MAQEKICQDCSQKKDCQEIYQQLGGAKGPSIVRKVVIAFLLPVVVFIVTLAIFEKILAKAISTKELKIGLSLLSALAVTFIVVSCSLLVGRKIKNQNAKSKM